jgi:hypothetical protein
LFLLLMPTGFSTALAISMVGRLLGALGVHVQRSRHKTDCIEWRAREVKALCASQRLLMRGMTSVTVKWYSKWLAYIGSPTCRFSFSWRVFPLLCLGNIMAPACEYASTGPPKYFDLNQARHTGKITLCRMERESNAYLYITLHNI